MAETGKNIRNVLSSIDTLKLKRKKNISQNIKKIFTN